MKKCFTERKQEAGIKLRIILGKIILSIVFIFTLDTNADAQLLEKKITINLSNVSVQEVLKQIENEAKIQFVYSEDQLNIKDKVSFSVSDKTLKEALDEFLTPLNVSYRVHEQERSITLRRQVRKTQSSGDRSDNNSQKKYLITGRVTESKKGESLAGVNIIVKGTAAGTTSDASGQFSLEVDEKAVLVFSFIGYVPYEAAINDSTIIDVVLQEDSKNLEEVTVNAGYWEVESKEQTGNISKVTSKQIESQPVMNPLQSIQGRVAGVQVQQLTGLPGDGLLIQIRGINSIRGGNSNDPLYIVDGIPFSSSSLFSNGSGVLKSSSPLNLINPADIQSIEILKDADATAIYGSRGSNGVVLITTKKGKSGRTQADINVYTGIGTMSRQLDLLNTSQYVAMRKEAFRNDGVTPTLANAPDLLLWDTTRYTDWKKQLLGGTAHITSAQASISGGSATTRFLVGGGFLKQTTVFPGDYNYQKGSARFNLGHSSSDSKFDMNLSGNFVFDNNLLPSTDLTVSVFSLAPNTPQVYNPNGTFNWENGTWTNPYADMKRVYKTASKNIVTNINMSYEVIPGLKVKANGGYNFLNSEENVIIPIASQNPTTSPTGQNVTTKGSINTWIFEPQIEFQRKLGEGVISTLGGMTFQQTVREKQGYIATGFINDTQLDNLAAGSALTLFSGEYSEYKYNAVFGRINYNWKEKYILNGTFRRDGSSRFGSNKKFANFGAIGAAWIFSHEKFLKNLVPSLSFGKLRGSFGVTGSDQIGDYQYLDTYSATSNTYQGGKGLIPNRLVNPDFGWEENRKLEGGIELGFFQDKLFFSASYYHNRSSNQLVGYALPSITGFTSIQSNLPAVIQNTGLELVVSNVNIKRGSFLWTSSLNMTLPTNRLVSYPNIEASSYANTYQVDRSLFVQKKYNSLGVNPQTGVYVFQDVDNSGTLTSADTQFLIEKKIDFFGGLQNSISYKRFELEFLFRFVKQIGNDYMVGLGNAPGTRANQPTFVLSRWQNPGDVSNVQRFTQGGAAVTSYSSFANTSDGVFVDASFVRLQNVSLSWTMPDALSGKIKAEKIRFYAQGQNLFVISDFRGADPETQNARTLSPLRIITIGAQLTF